MNIGAFLVAIIGPLAVRALIALGFTAVTFTGVIALQNQLLTFAQSSWATLPSAVLQLASLSGIPQGLGTVLGAYVAISALKAATGFKKYILK